MSHNGNRWDHRCWPTIAIGIFSFWRVVDQHTTDLLPSEARLYPVFSTAPSRTPAQPHCGFVEANPRPQHCAHLSVMRLLQGASPQGPKVESANSPPGAPGLGACVQVWVQTSACPERASGLVRAHIPLPISRKKPPPVLCTHFLN